jgi:hypothetical protein
VVNAIHVNVEGSSTCICLLQFKLLMIYLIDFTFLGGFLYFMLADYCWFVVKSELSKTSS